MMELKVEWTAPAPKFIVPHPEITDWVRVLSCVFSSFLLKNAYSAPLPHKTAQATEWVETTIEWS